MVKRYYYSSCEECVMEDPDGEFVDFTDYDALAARLARLRDWVYLHDEGLLAEFDRVEEASETVSAADKSGEAKCR